MKYVFFINPAAGKGRGPEIFIPKIEEYFAENPDESYKIIITESGEDAKKRAFEEASTDERLTFFACGGDGTFFEILNGAGNFDNVRFGILPCGSGNDFLKFFGDKEAFADIKRQIDGQAVLTDLIKVDDEYCINLCSLGMDAMVADGMTKYKKIPLVSGSMAYKLSIVKTFLRKLGVRAKITVDGTSLGTVDCLFAVCANGGVYGGGYNSCPSADPTDGRLEWLVVKTISKFKVPKFLALYEKGEHENLPYCMHGHCSVMEIETEKPEPVNMDGEIIHKQKVRFELIKHAVRFVLPSGVYEKYCVFEKQV